MSAAFGILHLSPAVFWSMTLPELSAALSPLAGDAGALTPLGSSDLGALMHRFPDTGGPR